MDNVIAVDFRRAPNTEAESRWCDAHEAGRHTRNLARKMVADIIEAKWHRRRGDVFMLRRMLREAMQARAAYHHMLRQWNDEPGFRDGLLRRDLVLTATHDEGGSAA